MTKLLVVVMTKKAIFFDLDNTLYDYTSYYSAVLRKISNYLSIKYGLPSEEIYITGMNLFKIKTSRYPKYFNDLLEIFNIPQHEVTKCLEIFNNYSEKLTPYEDVIPTLEKLRNEGYIVGIITDGNPKRQKQKIKLLGLEKYFDIIVFTHDLNSPKPSSIPYRYGLEKTGIHPSFAYYVGDDPRIDFKGAKEVGMTTIRILRGEFKDIPKNEYIDFEIDYLTKIFKII